MAKEKESAVLYDFSCSAYQLSDEITVPLTTHTTSPAVSKNSAPVGSWYFRTLLKLE